MKNMVKLFGIAALVLAMVFGMMVVGCEPEPDPEPDPVDPALNGTWVKNSGTGASTYTFNNGNWERPDFAKGTYTTGKNGYGETYMTLYKSHIWGPAYVGTAPLLNESKWYSKSDAKALYPDNVFFASTDEFLYSFEGDTLTLKSSTSGFAESTYTKTP
jgi:hypothetical protein